MTAWAASCQAAVTAIRKAGAINHHILLPGTGYTSAESFVSSGSAAALGKVKNLDGSVDNLIFDVHKYLDEDNSGTHSGCVSNAISTAFQPLAKYLTENKRVALLAEIGGGSSNSSCMTALCQVADFLNENSGAYLGMLGWGAGSFDDTYVLSLSPKQNGATWTDKPLLTKCIAGKFSGGSGYNTTTQSPPSSGGSSAGSSAGSYPSASSNPISSAPQPTSTYTPPTGPAPTAGGSGGNVPISYGAPMSWGTGNSTGSLTATGGNTATGTTSYQPTTFATSIVSTSAHGYGGYSSSTDTAAPASSSPALMRPGNNDGASVWGTKSHRPQHGSQDGKKMQGQQTSASGGHGGEDGDDCTSEYV